MGSINAPPFLLGVKIMQEFINAIVNNGTAIAVTAYFLYRDYKFNGELVVLLTTLKDLVTEVKKDIERGV